MNLPQIKYTYPNVDLIILSWLKDIAEQSNNVNVKILMWLQGVDYRLFLNKQIINTR